MAGMADMIIELVNVVGWGDCSWKVVGTYMSEVPGGVNRSEKEKEVSDPGTKGELGSIGMGSLRGGINSSGRKESSLLSGTDGVGMFQA